MHHKVNKQKNFTNLLIGGFGLIELMVTISILILVMGIILTKHSSFNGAVLLRGQAFNVALQAREIQLTAVSVISDSVNYRNVYGLHFDTTSQIINIFKDSDGGHFFEVGEEYGKQSKLDPRYKISEIRLDGASVLGGELSVVFERPNFDARFFVGVDNSGAGSSATSAEIDICLKNTSCTAGNVGEVRTVEITKTGQISVKN